MKRKNIMKITESKLKTIITETVKQILSEKVGRPDPDPNDAVGVRAAEACGFKCAYCFGRYEIWWREKPKTDEEKEMLIKRLGVGSLIEMGRETRDCFITVDLEIDRLENRKNRKDFFENPNKTPKDVLIKIAQRVLTPSEGLKVLVKMGYNEKDARNYIMSIAKKKA